MGIKTLNPPTPVVFSILERVRTQLATMSVSAVKYYPTLKILGGIRNKAARDRTYKSCCCQPGFVKALREGVKNVLNSNIPITPHAKRRLAKQKNLLRIISQRKTSSARARSLMQRGGFIQLLPALLPPIITTLGGLIGKAISRRRK